MTSERLYYDSFESSGYVVLPSVVSDRLWRASREFLYDLAQHRAGWRSSKKLHVEDALNVDGSVDAVVTNDAVVNFVRDRLIHPHLHGARFRAPLPGFGAQEIHTDDHADYAGPLRLITVIFPLDPFRKETGATRVIPASHKAHAQKLDISEEPVPGEEIISADPGDALLMSGQLWHSGTMNVSSTPRGALAVSWTEPSLWS